MIVTIQYGYTECKLKLANTNHFDADIRMIRNTYANTVAFGALVPCAACTNSVSS